MLKGFMLGIGLAFGLAVGTLMIGTGLVLIGAHSTDRFLSQAFEDVAQELEAEPIQTAYCRSSFKDQQAFNDCVESSFPSPLGVCLEEARQTMTILNAIQFCEERSS